MTAPPPARFDFLDARRLHPALARSLHRWQVESCELLTDAWKEVAIHPPRVAPGETAPARTAAGLALLADPGFGCVLLLGPASVPTLLGCSPTLLSGLLADVLGADSGPPLADRGLTPLEESVFELVLDRFRESLSDGWPAAAPLPVARGELCRPRRSRRLASAEELIVFRWTIVTRAVTEPCLWLVPRQELEALCATLDPPPAEAGPGEQRGLESLVTQCPLEVAVELGRAEISMSEIERLQIGDLLILDQPLQRPLVAQVSGSPVWQVRPCRRGQRQSVEITDDGPAS